MLLLNLPHYDEQNNFRFTNFPKFGIIDSLNFCGEVRLEKGFAVYILRCADGTLYTGYARDVQSRLKTHMQGKGAKYTRARLPVALVYEEHFSDKSSAMKREFEIKRMTKSDKLKLIQSS